MIAIPQGAQRFSARRGVSCRSHNRATLSSYLVRSSGRSNRLHKPFHLPLLFAVYVYTTRPCLSPRLCRVESSRVENPGLDLVTINEGYTKEKVARNGLVYEKCWTGRKRGDEIVHRDIRRHRMTDNERPRRYLNTRREC